MFLLPSSCGASRDDAPTLGSCTCIAVLTVLQDLWLTSSSSAELILCSRAHTGPDVSGLDPYFSSLPSSGPLLLAPSDIFFFDRSRRSTFPGGLHTLGFLPNWVDRQFPLRWWLSQAYCSVLSRDPEQGICVDLVVVDSSHWAWWRLVWVVCAQLFAAQG